MRMSPDRAALVLVALTLGCEPETAPARDQWTVVIGTDAPIPQFGDRLIVDVLDAEGGVCPTCSRQFSVAAVEDWPLSFGIVAAGDEVMVRAELFRADHLGFDGLPIGTAHLEIVGALPPPSGVTSVALDLTMDCFDIPADVGGRPELRRPDLGASHDRHGLRAGHLGAHRAGGLCGHAP